MYISGLQGYPLGAVAVCLMQVNLEAFILPKLGVRVLAVNIQVLLGTGASLEPCCDVGV